MVPAGHYVLIVVDDKGAMAIFDIDMDRVERAGLDDLLRNSQRAKAQEIARQIAADLQRARNLRPMSDTSLRALEQVAKYSKPQLATVFGIAVRVEGTLALPTSTGPADQIRPLTEKIAKLNDLARDAETKLAKEQVEHDRDRQELERVRKSGGDVPALFAEIERLRNELAARDRSVSDLTARTQALEAERDELRQRIAASAIAHDKQIVELQTRNQALTDQLKEARKDNAELQRINQAARTPEGGGPLPPPATGDGPLPLPSEWRRS